MRTQASGLHAELLKVAGGFFAISTAISIIQRAGSAVLQFSADLEQSRIAFTTMLGSVEAADAHLKELQKFALSTPFEFEGLVNASKRMQAMGFSAKQVVPILTDVGNAVAAVGGRREVLDRVILALSQIQAKGKVAAQEMNQLAEAGIPAWRILSEAIGKSRAETIKLAEDGKISGAVFLDAFQKFSQANFGGMMERQSRTFLGALSNIKDTLLQTSGTAFAPLFDQISQIADRMAQEMQSGKPGVEAAFNSILSGLVEMAGAAGGQIGSGLLDAIGKRWSNPREWQDRVMDVIPQLNWADALFKGFFQGLPDPEDLFGIGDVNVNAIPAAKVPDLKSPLQDLTSAQQENTEAVRKARDIYDDLSLKVIFYGQTSEVAATKQRLLAVGMEALTSAEGKQALRLAGLIDQMRIHNALAESQKKLQDDLATQIETKYKSAFDSLGDATDAARLQTLELGAAERGGLDPLERFNLTLGAQIEGMLALGTTSNFTAAQIAILSTSLSDARLQMNLLATAQEKAKSDAEVKRLGEQRSALLRNIREMEVDLNRQLRQVPSDSIQQLAEQLERVSTLKIRPGGLDLFVEKLRSGSVDAKTALAEITTAINNARGDLGEEFDSVSADIVNLFLKAEQLSDFFKREEATNKYKEALSALAQVIEGDTHLTNAQRVEKLLLADAYKNLTEAQIESLRATAMQADMAEQARARRREMQEVAEDLGLIFSDVFGNIRDGWRGMWDDMARTARNIAQRISQEMFTALFSRLFNVPFESRAGGLVGLITNGILARNGTSAPGSAGSSLASGLALLPKRAFGGPVFAGAPVIVGDHPFNRPNPEVFIPPTNGTIVPLSRFQGQSDNRAFSGRESAREIVEASQPIINIALVDSERAAEQQYNASERAYRKMVRRNRKLRF